LIEEKNCILIKYKIRLLFKKLVLSKLFSVSIIITILGGITGILGYVYQVLIGRLLNSTELGLFGATVSLVSILSSPLGAISLVLSKRVTSLYAKNDIVGLKNIGKKIIIFVFIGIVIFVLTAYFSFGEVKKYLNSTDNYIVWLFVGLVSLSAIASLNTAFFQGLQKFNSHALLGVVWALLKIIGAVILVGYFDGGISGAIESLLLAKLLFCLMGAYIVIKNIFKLSNNFKKIQVTDDDKTILTIKDCFLMASASTSFVIMTQLDMVLVNQFFPSDIASNYAAAAILGKAVLYIPGGLVFALFPMVINNNVNNISSAYLIKQALIITLIFCLPVSLIYFFFGVNIVEFLYGNKYAMAGNLLQYFGFLMLPLALMMVFEHFLLAKGRILFTLIFVLLVPLEILALQYLHESLYQFMSVMFIFGIAATFLGAFSLWFDFNKKLRK